MKITYLLPMIGCGCSLLSSCMSAQQEKEAKHPNILFILSDDHTRAAVSAYGGINAEIAPTPNIDAIGQNGAIMQNMLCTNSISGPSRACLLTGKYSHNHGFYQNEGGIIFNGNQQQYQKILREHGYITSLFGKWHLKSTPQGFDYYMIHANPNQQGTYWDPLYEINGKKEVRKGYATTLTTDAALEWLDGVKDQDKPFCMMLHFKAPHRSWEPDSCYLNLFDDVDFPYPATFDDDYKGRELTLGRSMAKIEHHLSRGDLKQVPPAGLTPKERNKWLWWGGSGQNQFWTPDSALTGHKLKEWKFQNYIKDYFRVIRSVDDQVGRVIEYLKKNNLYENTILVYMGDQGFYIGEHGIYDKRWMYEESLQMPCVISYPKAIKKGIRPEELTLNVDVAPTLLDFAGIEAPADMDGVSIKGVLTGDAEVKKNWRKSAYYQYYEYPLYHNVQPHYGVRTDRYKLIHYYYDVDVWELFDLQTDPHELQNLYGQPAYDDLVTELKEEIVRLQQQYGDTISLDARRKMTEKYMRRYQE